jgi:predicted membrane-bound mannosyltransferase
MPIKKTIKNWKSVIFFSPIIITIAIFIRTYNLTSIPVFADEAIYIRWAQVMQAEPTLRFLPLSDGKQPLFMWTVIPFLKLFTDPLVAGRMVSVATGIGSLVGIFILSYVLFKNKTVSLAASLIYAISPFTVF